VPDAPRLDNVLVGVRDRVATVTLNRPEQRNPLSTGMLGDLGSALAWCRDEPSLGFAMLTDLTAVDYLKYPGHADGPRFEVVYHLYSLAHNHRLRLKVKVDEDDPVVPTAVDLWPIANWLEREVWDMFGVRFADHPDLRRLLMYEEFVGHPLRKEYPIDRRQPLIGPPN